MSHSLLHELLPHNLHACVAIRTTERDRNVLKDENLAKAAAPHAENMIAEIDKSATSG